MASDKAPRKIRIGAIAYEVRMVPKDHSDIGSGYGATRQQEGEILLVRGQSRECLLDTFFHEILHAYMEASGLGRVLGLIGKCATEEARAEVEETVVRLLAASLRPALESAGWTPPKNPGKL
jgi:hypothetical protein